MEKEESKDILSSSLKIDKNDVRARRHYFKTIVKDGKEMKVWECGLCAKEFKFQYTLVRHIPTHTDVRNYQCNMCPKAFRQLSTLAQHKVTHLNLRPYICEYCHKAFNRISTLISHKKIHYDVKRHICTYCGKGFHQKGNLQNHMYTHTNERPYKCEICLKGFNQKSNLASHKLSAHFKKVWHCHICKMRFGLESSYIMHLRTIHATDPPTPGSTEHGFKVSLSSNAGGMTDYVLRSLSVYQSECNNNDDSFKVGPSGSMSTLVVSGLNLTPMTTQPQLNLRSNFKQTNVALDAIVKQEDEDSSVEQPQLNLRSNFKQTYVALDAIIKQEDEDSSVEQLPRITPIPKNNCNSRNVHSSVVTELNLPFRVHGDGYKNHQSAVVYTKTQPNVRNLGARVNFSVDRSTVFNDYSNHVNCFECWSKTAPFPLDGSHFLLSEATHSPQPNVSTKSSKNSKLLTTSTVLTSSSHHHSIPSDGSTIRVIQKYPNGSSKFESVMGRVETPQINQILKDANADSLGISINWTGQPNGSDPNNLQEIISESQFYKEFIEETTEEQCVNVEKERSLRTPSPTPALVGHKSWIPKEQHALASDVMADIEPSLFNGSDALKESFKFGLDMESHFDFSEVFGTELLQIANLNSTMTHGLNSTYSHEKSDSNLPADLSLH